MATRKVLHEGDEGLRKKSREVQQIDDRILTLLDDLKDTMYEHNGAGLAAPQVGVLRQVAVIDVGEGLIELINPKIIKMEGSQLGEEGCLSAPGLVVMLERPEKVTVSALNREGKKMIYHVSGFSARAFCHEIDHLSGKMFIDYPHEIVNLEKDEES